MKNIQEIVVALEKGAYDMEAWDFKGQEPSGAQSWCEDWFNKQSLKYKLERVSFDIDDHIDNTDDVKWIIDFYDVLNEYWIRKCNHGGIGSAYYAVTLNV